jgi:hypothetical protein
MTQLRHVVVVFILLTRLPIHSRQTLASISQHTAPRLDLEREEKKRERRRRERGEEEREEKKRYRDRCRIFSAFVVCVFMFVCLDLCLVYYK